MEKGLFAGPAVRRPQGGLTIFGLIALVDEENGHRDIRALRALVTIPEKDIQIWRPEDP